MAERPRAVVLQRAEALGDALLHVGAFRALRAALPQHEIVHLYGFDGAFRKVLSGLGAAFFDDIRRVPAIQAGALPTRRVLREIGGIDLVLDLRSQRHCVWSRLACSGGVARRFVGNSVGYVMRKGVGGLAEPRPAANYQRIHRLVEIAVGRALPFDPSLPVSAAASAAAARLLPAGGRWLGIIPGPSGSAKAWPRDRLLAFAGGVTALGLTPVFLLGSAESERALWVRSELPQAVVIDVAAAGGDSAAGLWLVHAAAARLAACVATEGGLGHLVASTGVPLITLAGAADPRWRPVTPLWRAVEATSFGSRRMDAIPVEAVLAAVHAIAAWMAPRLAAAAA